MTRRLVDFDTRVTNLLENQKKLLNEFVDVLYQNPEEVKNNLKVLAGLDLKLLNIEIDIINIFLKFIKKFRDAQTIEDIHTLIQEFIDDLNSYLLTLTTEMTNTVVATRTAQIRLSGVLTDTSSSIEDLVLEATTLISDLIDHLLVTKSYLNFNINF